MLKSEQIQEISDLYREGYSQKDISSKTGIALRTVGTYLKKQGIIPRRAQSEQEQELLKQMGEANEKMKEALRIKSLKEKLDKKYKEIEKIKGENNVMAEK